MSIAAASFHRTRLLNFASSKYLCNLISPLFAQDDRLMIRTHELAPGLFLQSIMEWMIKAGFDLD